MIDDDLDNLLLFDPAALAVAKIVWETYAVLTRRFGRPPAEARRIIVERLKLQPAEVDRALGGAA